MNKLLFFIILLSLSFNVKGQKFTVPESILSDVESKQFEYTHIVQFDYKIVYPDNYDSTKSYNVFLGLSGGNANEQIVNYCYYTLFDSKYLDDYIIVMPLGPTGRPLSDLSENEIDYLIEDIMKNQKVTNQNWIVAGTSMGGFASFNFARARPELFEGIITFPGGIQEGKPSDQWSNYKILLAVGELDDADWTGLNEKTKTELEGKVKSIETFILKGQEHIISPEYNIDLVYEKYFGGEK